MSEEEVKDYTVTFYDGSVKRMTGKKSELQLLNIVSIKEAGETPFTLFKQILPMSINEGPPLPRIMNVKWPGREL